MIWNSTDLGIFKSLFLDSVGMKTLRYESKTVMDVALR